MSPAANWDDLAGSDGGVTASRCGPGPQQRGSVAPVGVASDDAEEAVLRALPVDLDELADLLEGGDEVRFGLVDLQTGVVYPYSEMSGGVSRA